MGRYARTCLTEGMGSVARHLGALAFLHDTVKALAAYRRAVALDPHNPDSWNQLGHLLLRVGELDETSVMYRKALTRSRTMGAKPQIEQIQAWLDELQDDANPTSS